MKNFIQKYIEQKQNIVNIMVNITRQDKEITSLRNEIYYLKHPIGEIVFNFGNFSPETPSKDTYFIVSYLYKGTFYKLCTAKKRHKNYTIERKEDQAFITIGKKFFIVANGCVFKSDKNWNFK